MKLTGFIVDPFTSLQLVFLILIDVLLSYKLGAISW
jgi:hypothetical protein